MLKYFDKFIKVKDIWEKDKERIDRLTKEANLDILVIWESDYVRNPANEIFKCINFLNN